MLLAKFSRILFLFYAEFSAATILQQAARLLKRFKIKLEPQKTVCSPVLKVYEVNTAAGSSPLFPSIQSFISTPR